MKVAIVIPVRWDPSLFSLDPRHYQRGFACLGHDTVIICLEGSSPPTDASVLTATEMRMADSSYWRSLGVELAVVFTWMVLAHDVVTALRRAGAVVVSKGDTDGLLGVRVHPRATAVRSLYGAVSPLDALRRGWHWSKRYTYLHRREDADLLHNLEEADATIVETFAARTNLLKLLDRYGVSELASRLHIVAAPLDDRFCSGTVETERRQLVVAVGRWREPAKDVRLLRRTLRRLPGLEVAVVGPEGDDLFADLVPPKRYMGRVSPDELQQIYAEAQVCLVTSRWEGYHGAGHEALAMGCTIVGTPIPAVASMAFDRRFGTIGASRRSTALASALEHELTEWAAGRRMPREIADYWRRQVSAEAVAAQIVVAAGSRLTPSVGPEAGNRRSR